MAKSKSKARSSGAEAPPASGPARRPRVYRGASTAEVRALAAVLSDRQLAFANAVLAGESQVAAYVSAGYTAKTDGARYTGGAQIVRSPKVAAYIAAVRALVHEPDREAGTDAAIASVAEIAEFHTACMRSDPLGIAYDRHANAFTVDPERADARAIQGIRFDRDGNPEVRFVDRLAASRELGRHLGYYAEPERPDRETVVHLHVNVPAAPPASDDLD